MCLVVSVERPIIYYLNLVNAKKTIVVSYFVVDLLAKLSHPSLPRADCSLWKHGAEHCRTVCLARGSARMPAYHSMQVGRGADLGLPGRGTPSG